MVQSVCLTSRGSGVRLPQLPQAASRGGFFVGLAPHTYSPLSPQGKVFSGELSSVGSERLPYKQRVGGSTPSAPTPKTVRKRTVFFCLFLSSLFPFFLFLFLSIFLRFIRASSAPPRGRLSRAPAGKRPAPHRKTECRVIGLPTAGLSGADSPAVGRIRLFDPHFGNAHRLFGLRRHADPQGFAYHGRCGMHDVETVAGGLVGVRDVELQGAPYAFATAVGLPGFRRPGSRRPRGTRSRPEPRKRFRAPAPDPRGGISSRVRRDRRTCRRPFRRAHAPDRCPPRPTRPLRGRSGSREPFAASLPVRPPAHCRAARPSWSGCPRGCTMRNRVGG